MVVSHNSNHLVRIYRFATLLSVGFLALLSGCKNGQPSMGNPFLSPDRVPAPSTKLYTGAAAPYYQGAPAPGQTFGQTPTPGSFPTQPYPQPGYLPTQPVLRGGMPAASPIYNNQPYNAQPQAAPSNYPAQRTSFISQTNNLPNHNRSATVQPVSFHPSNTGSEINGSPAEAASNVKKTRFNNLPQETALAVPTDNQQLRFQSQPEPNQQPAQSQWNSSSTMTDLASRLMRVAKPEFVRPRLARETSPLPQTAMNQPRFNNQAPPTQQQTLRTNNVPLGNGFQLIPAPQPSARPNNNALGINYQRLRVTPLPNPSPNSLTAPRPFIPQPGDNRLSQPGFSPPTAAGPYAARPLNNLISNDGFRPRGSSRQNRTPLGSPAAPRLDTQLRPVAYAQLAPRLAQQTPHQPTQSQPATRFQSSTPRFSASPNPATRRTVNQPQNRRPAVAQFGYSPDRSWLRGEVFQDPTTGRLKLRYVQPGQTDEHGGAVYIENPDALPALRLVDAKGWFELRRTGARTFEPVFTVLQAQAQ